MLKPPFEAGIIALWVAWVKWQAHECALWVAVVWLNYCKKMGRKRIFFSFLFFGGGGLEEKVVHPKQEYFCQRFSSRCNAIRYLSLVTANLKLSGIWLKTSVTFEFWRILHRIPQRKTQKLGKAFAYKKLRIQPEELAQSCSEHRANYSFAFY